MPPTFRSSRSGRQLGDGVNRTRTGQIDHDVFEGLPVRRWTRQLQTVSQEPKTDVTESEAPGNGGNQSIPEHPMPRDSHLLAPMSRALLRAARSGCIYIRQASKDFEDEEKEATDPEEQQGLQNAERNFSMRKWATVPKHLEPPEVEFLAKRRPGLPSLYGATAGTVEGANGSAPMRKTRFKKVDPVTGNISIYAAWVPEGHKIEGEVTDDAQLVAGNSKVTVTPEAPAPGTVIEGVGVVNAEGVVVAEAGSAAVLTPPRRRPPPPKRKGKGLKGRRKKVMFAPGEGADASLVHGAGAGAGGNAANYGKDTDSSRMSVDHTTQDDEDDDGEEGEESDDGEGEGEGEGDESGLDAKTPETPGPQPGTESESKPASGPATEPIAAPASVQVSGATLAPGPVQTPTQSAVPLEEPSHPAANPASSIPTDKPSEVTATPTPGTEDVQMTDAGPTDDALPPSAPVSNTQPQTAPEITQPVRYGKPPSPPYAQQAPVPAPTNVTMESAGEPIGEQPMEPQDVIMAESSGPVSEPAHADTGSLETPVAALQLPQAEASEPVPVPQQLDPQQGANDFDLLDNLEASLNHIHADTVGDKQQGDPSQEATAESEPPRETPAGLELAEAPTKAQESAPEEAAAPTVPTATLPDPEQAPAQEQQQAIPPLQPSTLPEQASNTPAFPEPLSTQIPIESSEQAIPEQPGRQETPSDAPAPPVPIAEPPKAEESSLPSLPEQPPKTETLPEVAPQVATEPLEDKGPVNVKATISVQPVSEAQISPPVTSGVMDPFAMPEHDKQQPVAGLTQQGEVEGASGNDFSMEEETKS
ncbi:hypothetical protein BJX63DRAFT_386520 [Aspergillus granulosus]|uniref:LYR family protein n=1 Tax=Aspergillus granulosus TaxID=176169 RepID=A0ABR4HN30_9EURO